MSLRSETILNQIQLLWLCVSIIFEIILICLELISFTFQISIVVFVLFLPDNSRTIYELILASLSLYLIIFQVEFIFIPLRDYVKWNHFNISNHLHLILLLKIKLCYVITNNYHWCFQVKLCQNY